MCDFKAILNAEVLTCPICQNEFASKQYQPVSLCCGHTICRACLNAAENRQCPFDQRVFNEEALNLPTNTAILRILHNNNNNNNNNNLTNGNDHHHHHNENSTNSNSDANPGDEQQQQQHQAGGGGDGGDGQNNSVVQNPEEAESFNEAMQYFESMALHLKSFLNDEYTGSALSRPMLRKIAMLIKCQLVEEEGRLRAFRAVHSLAERAITDVILKYQDPQHLCTNLWTQVRARGCQFLGADMQSEVLRSVLAALEDGAALARKTIVMMVLERFKPNYPQTSKTSIGRVVQLLYRACCFKIVKRESESSLMELKEEFRNYEALRREHDKEIIRIAHEAGLFIAATQWSTLLYGDSAHIPYLQNVVNALKTPLAFDRRIDGLKVAAQRLGNITKFDNLSNHLKILSGIDACFETTTESEPPTWDDLNKSLNAVLHILDDINEIMHINSNPYMLDYQGGSKRNLNTKYKISLCRDVLARRPCPRGKKCTFAHTPEELGKYRDQYRESLHHLGGNGPESCNTPIDHQMALISPVDSSSNSNPMNYTNGEIIENQVPTTSRLIECIVSPSPPVLQAPPPQTLVPAQPNIDPVNGNHDDDSDYCSDAPHTQPPAPMYVNYMPVPAATWEHLQQQMEQGNFMGAQGPPPYYNAFPDMVPYFYPYGNSNMHYYGPNYSAPSFQVPIYHPPLWDQQQQHQQNAQPPPPPPPPQSQQPQPQQQQQQQQQQQEQQQQPQQQPPQTQPQPQQTSQHPLQPTAPPFYPGKPFYSGHYSPAPPPAAAAAQAPVDGFIYGHTVNEAGYIYAAAPPNGRPHRGNFYPNFPYNGSKKANLSKANGY